MALLNILQFPDPRLKNIAAPVTVFDACLGALIDNMLETMYEASGVGLAATQVNIQQQVIVIDISEDKNQAFSLINPKILSTEGHVDYEEGCLSFPATYGTVRRAKIIEVHFLDQTGHEKTLKADGLLSICIQHEIDHLHGITFYDHLSLLKQGLIRKKLAKRRKKVL